MRYWAGLGLLLTVAVTATAADLPCEKLGEPVRIRTLAFDCVTQNPDGAYTAWGGFLENGLGRSGLVGVRLDTGAVTFVDFSGFGPGKRAVVKGADGNVYAYAGSPAHFVRYDVSKQRLDDLGVPVSPAGYYADAGAVGPDGVFYMGSFPTATLVACDTRTGKVENLGRMPTDERQSYLYPQVAVSDEGFAYCPVGLHHKELWAFDTKSRQKRQVLPPEMTAEQGTVTVWRGADGEVYGQGSGKRFRCHPDRIEVVENAVAAVPSALVAGEESVGSLREDGSVVLKNLKTGQERRLQTAYEGSRAMIFSVSCERDGVIYGSSLLPGNSFSYDTHSGKLTDLGLLDSGKCQVYDTISLPQGLFLASYFGAFVDLYDPAQPRKAGVNPRRLGQAAGQERPMQWCLGPDGMLYTGTEPAKGRLGGALLRVNPQEGTLKVWPTPVINQSLEYLAPVPETGELFVTTSIVGGSSAKPTAKAAKVFLWDLKQEKLVWEADPLPGTTAYRRVVRAANGLIYGLTVGQYYVLDPVKRQVVKTGDLPVQSLAFPYLSDEPVGARGLIYGVGDDAVFALNPADHSATVVGRHPSLKGAHGFMVTTDGVLYYGSGPELWRCKLPQ